MKKILLMLCMLVVLTSFGQNKKEQIAKFKTQLDSLQMTEDFIKINSDTLTNTKGIIFVGNDSTDNTCHYIRVNKNAVYKIDSYIVFAKFGENTYYIKGNDVITVSKENSPTLITIK